MEHSNLIDLIYCLEYGTKIHISVVFLDKYGNFKTQLPVNSVIHANPYCDYVKTLPGGLAKCLKCKDKALAKAINGKTPFAGFCFNGIYEYCHPVVYDDAVIAVIFIGNILPETSAPYSKKIQKHIDTFERNFDEEKYKLFGQVLENHIKLLISEYSGIKSEFNPLVMNIRNYIAESLQYDISVSRIADVFNYNEQYIGKLFKKHTGNTIKEYLNNERLKKAEELLKKTTFSISEISTKTGFNNVTYFNRIFKRHFNMSPKEYRNLVKLNAQNE